MTPASTSQFAVGLRQARVYELNDSGLPKATSTTVYEGYELVGAKAADLNPVEPRKINHAGNDRSLAVDFLPPQELPTGELRTAAQDLTLQALLTSVKVRQIGEAQIMPRLTDKQGQEPSLGMLMYQQSLDANTKVRNWRFQMMSAIKVFPLVTGMGDNPAEARYPFAPAPSKYHLWGELLTEDDDGALETPIIDGQSIGKPHLVAWLANGTAVDYNFHASRPCIQTYANKVAVWIDGTLVDPGDYTPIATKITFDAAPAASSLIVAFYEY